jgi:hypothetical protein
VESDSLVESEGKFRGANGVIECNRLSSSVETELCSVGGCFHHARR